jgi:hypothetical protein
MLVKLHVSRSDQLDQLVAYWGRGGRERDVRPILESLSHFRRDQVLDIVHLLPPLARRRLYTYGRDNERNCYWTALNYFNETPDDRLLDLNFVAYALSNQWHIVTGPPRFGDVAVFHDEGEVARHGAVFLADDLMFTKNGIGTSRPWVLMRLPHLRDIYWREPPLQVRYYRRNDLS